MINNGRFDEHIKEQFSNYSPEVHPRIWENIMAEREKRKPAGFWFTLINSRNRLLLAGLLIALCSTGTWLYLKKFSNNSNGLAIVEDTKPQTDKNNENYIENTQPIPGGTQEGNVNTESVLNNTSANNNSALSSAAIIKTNIKPATASADYEENGVSFSSKKNKKTYTGLGSVLINSTAPSLFEDDYEGQGSLLGRLTFSAQKYSVNKKDRKPTPLTFNPVVYFPDCPSFEKNASGNKKYFEFFIGPDYAFKSLQDTGNSAYLQKRKESTSFRSAFSAGIRYTKVFNNSMSIRGGVTYSQINEKFKYSEGNVIQVTYIINANGDTIGSYSTTGTRYKTTINRYRSIDIPLVVGYELGNGRLHANINAGAVVNIYSWQKGDVLDTAGRPVNISTGKNSSPYQFKTNAGIGFIAAVSVYYKLNDRLHLMAEPYFRYNFSPMNKESITLKQKYQTAGLRLGVRLDLK
ncbi:MAG: hypothetical protein WBP16_17045 [Ferruginibacter sp.]